MSSNYVSTSGLVTKSSPFRISRGNTNHCVHNGLDPTTLRSNMPFSTYGAPFPSLSRNRFTPNANTANNGAIAKTSNMASPIFPPPPPPKISGSPETSVAGARWAMVTQVCDLKALQQRLSLQWNCCRATLAWHVATTSCARPRTRADRTSKHLPGLLLGENVRASESRAKCWSESRISQEMLRRVP